jgi:hypothetical protein
LKTAKLSWQNLQQQHLAAQVLPQQQPTQQVRQQQQHMVRVLVRPQLSCLSGTLPLVHSSCTPMQLLHCCRWTAP